MICSLRRSWQFPPSYKIQQIPHRTTLLYNICPQKVVFCSLLHLTTWWFHLGWSFWSLRRWRVNISITVTKNREHLQLDCSPAISFLTFRKILSCTAQQSKAQIGQTFSFYSLLSVLKTIRNWRWEARKYQFKVSDSWCRFQDIFF